MASTHHTDEINGAGYEYFLNEIQEIREAKDLEGDPGSEEELESKTPDEAEEAEEWLKSAGYEEVVKQVLEGKDVDDDFIEAIPLTKAQKVTIKRRVNTLRSTVQKRKNKHGKTDVRNILWQHSQPNSPRTATPKIECSHSGNTTQSSSVQRLSRNLSVNKRREYNMKTDGLQHTDVGVEMLSIQLKDPSFQHSGCDDSLLSPKSHISLPLLESTTNLNAGSQHQTLVSSESENSSSTVSPSSSPLPSSPSPYLYDHPGSKSIDGLPTITIEPNSHGITYIDDLSAQDAAKLRPLILLELTASLDHFHITYTRRKSKRRYKDTGVFGVPLHILLEQDQKTFKQPGLMVPLVFKQLIALLCKGGVQEEGILRVPGSVTRIKALRKKLDETFHHGTFQWDEVRPNDAAGLLKLLIRELPVPLLTLEYVEVFAKVERIPDLYERIRVLNLLILILPDVHRNTLKLLLRFLKKVISHKDNLMTLNNVAMIMAPNLFFLHCGRSQNKAVSENEFQLAAGTSNIVRMLIFYEHLLWVVPTTMLEQLRYQNEIEQNRKSRDKPFIRLLKKDKSDNYKKTPINDEESYNQNVIRVKVPSMNKFNTAKQLDPNITAGDLVSQCLQDIAGPHISCKSTDQSSSAGQGDHKGQDHNAVQFNQSFLFEVGGNIGERKLDPSTKVLEVLKRNPNAEWIIRPQSQDIC